MSTPPTNPIPSSADPVEGGPTGETARDRRLVVIVEAFLRQVRNGGSLDPEPFLQAASDLRGDLTPLLHGVLRLEQISQSMDSQSRTSPPGAVPGSEGEQPS